MASSASVEVKPTSYSYVFSPYREPVAHVKPGPRQLNNDDGARAGSRTLNLGIKSPQVP